MRLLAFQHEVSYGKIQSLPDQKKSEYNKQGPKSKKKLMCFVFILKELHITNFFPQNRQPTKNFISLRFGTFTAAHLSRRIKVNFRSW